MLQGHQNGKSLEMKGLFFAEAEWSLSTRATILQYKESLVITYLTMFPM